MSLTLIQSIWTVVVMVIFLGIVWWAYNSGRKQAFDQAAQIPLEDEQPNDPRSGTER
ncbi:MAG: cbb3-type cytochrome c oxidase subunit 3 [Pseudomonadota bacterium]